MALTSYIMHIEGIENEPAPDQSESMLRDCFFLKKNDACKIWKLSSHELITS